MNAHERQYLRAELSELNRLIEQTPAEDVLDRASFMTRKQELTELLASQPDPSQELATARLTFRGRPVFGSSGILADFAAEAVQTFADAVAAVGASLGGPMGSRGQISNRDRYNTLITGTAHGSFGFVLEEAPQNDRFPFHELSWVSDAFERVRSIMTASLGSDDDFVDAIADTDGRALEALRKFLETLAKQEATCAFEFNNDTFRFKNMRQVRRSVDRLTQDNIHEDDVEIPGSFLGVLPEHRTFEFRRADNGEVIRGKVSIDIADAGKINDLIEKPMNIKVHTKTVGTVKPRYVLLEYSQPE